MFVSENIGIESFRERIFVIKQYINESIGITQNIFKSLLDAAIRQTATMGSFWTSNTSSTSNTSQTTSTGITSESASTSDGSQSISTGDTEENIEGGN